MSIFFPNVFIYLIIFILIIFNYYYYFSGFSHLDTVDIFFLLRPLFMLPRILNTQHPSSSFHKCSFTNFTISTIIHFFPLDKLLFIISCRLEWHASPLVNRCYRNDNVPDPEWYNWTHEEITGSKPTDPSAIRFSHSQRSKGNRYWLCSLGGRGFLLSITATQQSWVRIASPKQMN